MKTNAFAMNINIKFYQVKRLKFKFYKQYLFAVKCDMLYQKHMKCNINIAKFGYRVNFPKIWEKCPFGKMSDKEIWHQFTY